MQAAKEYVNGDAVSGEETLESKAKKRKKERKKNSVDASRGKNN